MRALLALFFYWSLLNAFPFATDAHRDEGTDLSAAFSVNEGNGSVGIEPEEAPRPVIVQQRHIYTTITQMPKHVFVGEIYPVTLRTVVTAPDVAALNYRFKNARGTKLFTPFTDGNISSGTVYIHTLYFKATNAGVRIPDIVPILSRQTAEGNESVTVAGKALDTTRLNPPADFCGIVADRFRIATVKSTVYDPEHTIAVFEADANRSDLADFHIAAAIKQGFEFLETSPTASRMSYFAIFPANVRQLELSYFNLQTRRYEHIRLLIVPEDDSVSTMSDLAPKAHGHMEVKTASALIAGIVFLTLFYYKRAKTYLLFALIAIALAAWLGAPIRHVCLKRGSEIYLLPMQNATVFERTTARQTLEVAGAIEGYTKVRLPDNKIGWIRDEDLCSP